MSREGNADEKFLAERLAAPTMAKAAARYIPAETPFITGFNAVLREVDPFD